MNFQSQILFAVRIGWRIFLSEAPVAMLCAVLLTGCVRVSGGAGYWHTSAEGETQTKKVGFDTANLVPDKTAPGKITI